jgi:hypothetical protein
MGLLGPYRVLDLTEERGLLMGGPLADVGVDLVRVEPRRRFLRPPFLTWWRLHP